ncbi:glucuronyl esterase domain-containing protein [Streptomyces griseoviridis]|uniref:glucuronyl esterase domain-containing protein n=1 Tax=Streptomyces griseoviridis TaxID=45398 RepID=UPI003F53FD43
MGSLTCPVGYRALPQQPRAPLSGGSFSCRHVVDLGPAVPPGGDQRQAETIDVVQRSDGSIRETDATAVTGCSRHGKGALVAGASVAVDGRSRVVHPVHRHRPQGR